MVAWGLAQRRFIFPFLRRTAVVATLLAAVAIGAMVVASHLHAAATHDEDDDSPRATTLAVGDKLDVRLDAEGQLKGGIDTVEPKIAAFQAVTRVYGTVLSLDRLTVTYNDALTDAAKMKAAQVRAAASLTASTRAKNLLKVFPTAQAQAETAAATAQIDATGVDTAKAQAEALRNTAVQDWGKVIGDAIVNRDALATDLVQRRTVLVQIALGDDRVAVPPKQIALSVGGGGKAAGHLLAEATQSDPRFSGVTYLYIVPATAGFAVGASVTAELPMGEAQSGVDVPPSAVVWQAGKPWLYVRTAPTTFKRCEIDETATPTAIGGYVVPARSLPREKPIVTAGAQILLSQEMHSQIPVDDDN